MNAFRHLLDKPWFAVTAGTILIFLLGLLDYWTGEQMSFSIFYVLPISLITWYTSWKYGGIAAMTSSTVWLIATRAAGTVFIQPFILYWNAGVRLAFFLLIVYLESNLKSNKYRLEERIVERTRLLEDEIAERRKAELRLQALSLKLLEIQEDERRQIARELHDEIGQELTGLRYLIEMAQCLPAEATGKPLQQSYELVVGLMEQVGRLSLELRPTLLDDLGLLPTLLWYFDRYSSQTGVRVRLKHQGLDGIRFSPEVETAAYRIVQEALTNVSRHSNVREVDVALWVAQSVLGIQVQDRGCGFDLDQALASGDSSGLSGMRERARLLGGKLSIESNLDNGTCLLAELPVHQPFVINQEIQVGHNHTGR